MARQLSLRKTKIVATIGPASWERDQLARCLSSGMNVARLNFSHGTLDRHRQTVENIRQVSEELGAPIAILQDLQGPKIRLAHFENEKRVASGDEIQVFGPGTSPEDHIVIEWPQIIETLEVGQSIFVDDGIVEWEVLEKKKNHVVCRVIHGGILRSRKGVNLPDAELPIASLTEKDVSDLRDGAPLGFDYVALSFVRTAEDLRFLRKKMKEFGISAKVIAKIEKKEAIENLSDIVHEADGIMIARGDLAVEIGQVHLPVIQKKIIRMCNRIGRPVITATQMLDSMQENSRPTRAEVTDVANAVLDGSDALMLSGESAFGKYPAKSLQTMHEIICEVEKQKSIYYRFKNRTLEREFTVPESIATSAVLCAQQLEVKTIVCVSTTGKTAQLIAQIRPKAQIIAATADRQALNRLELCWGLQTLKIDQFNSTEEAIEKIEQMLLAHKIVEHGDPVVLTLGVPVVEGQKTNAIRVFRVGRSQEDTMSDEDLPLRYQPFPF